MRNVDIIAIGLLLTGIAVYAHIRHMVVFEISSHRIGVFPANRAIIVPAVPAPPPIPHVRIMRD